LKVQTIASPADIKPQGTPEHVRTARAVAAYNKGQSSYDSPQSQPEVIQEKPEQRQVVAQQTQETTTSYESEEPQTTLPDSLATAAPIAEDPAAKQFSQLARQTRALRQRQQQLEQSMKSKEAELVQREAAIKAQETKYGQGYIQQDSLKNDPLRALLDAGVSYDTLTEQLLAQSNPMDPRVEAQFSRFETEIKALRQQNEELQNNSKKSEETQYQAAVKQIKADVTALVNNDPSYEGIKATNSINDVVELIEQTYKEDGTLLSVEEAAQEIEDYLIEEAVKLSQLSKVAKRRQLVSTPVSTPAPQQSAQSQVPKQPQPMKTLTNANASTRPLSAKERAMLAFKGELKNR
jgi:hypothetical protein